MAVQLKPDYLEARYNLGSSYLTLGRADEAIAELQEVLRKEPGFEPAQRALMKAERLKASGRSN
jgi:tetratricopeptide (TPR) repeat protein